MLTIFMLANNRLKDSLTFSKIDFFSDSIFIELNNLNLAFSKSLSDNCSGDSFASSEYIFLSSVNSFEHSSHSSK